VTAPGGDTADPAVARADAPATHGFLGAILVGGKNTRFGDHKGMARVGGVRIADRARRALAEAGCARVVLIANEPEAYAPLGLPSRADERAGLGPLGGLHAALLWANELGAPGALVVAGDMPFVSPGLLRELAESAAGPETDAAVPRSDGKRGLEPLCAAYALACLPAIEENAHGGGARLVSFYDDVRVRAMPKDRVRTFGDPARLFQNVNTRAELEEAERLASGAPVSGGEE
jgi:molybdopterin-guanine dinucleotide biosynthesis protein A